MSLINNNELFLLEEIVKKNFSSKYKGSVLGLFWTILSPLLMMTLFTIVFSTIFSRNIDNYAIYFICGWCLFQFFNSAIFSSMNSLKGNKNILQKTPAPKHIFVLGAILSEFLNYLIMLILLIVVMIVTHSSFHLPILFFSLIPVFLLFLMITGLGLILSVVCVYYTDVLHLWSVVSMFLMYASAIFYPMEIIPQPYRQVLMLNPIYCFIDQFRCFVYQGVFPQSISVIYSLLLSLIVLLLGIIVFKKYEDKVAMKF